jgi:hypothetical protein
MNPADAAGILRLWAACFAVQTLHRFTGYPASHPVERIS